MKLVLETNRTILKPFEGDESELFHKLSCDSFIRKYLWDDEKISMKVAKDVISRSTRYFKRNGFGIWKIEYIEIDEIIGYAGLWYFFEEEQPQLIYALRENFTKKGIATEVAKRIVHYAFEELNYKYLIASMDEMHHESQKVTSRIGMKLFKREELNEKPTVFYKINNGYINEWNNYGSQNQPDH